MDIKFKYSGTDNDTRQLEGQSDSREQFLGKVVVVVLGHDCFAMLA